MASISSPAAALQEARRLLEEADRCRQQGQFDRAESMCHALIRKHASYAAAYHTLGLVYLDKRNFDRALDSLVRASMLDPDNWLILTALGRTYLRLGANEMAAQTLDRARQMRPQEASILVSLADVLRMNREYEAAAPAYREALAGGISSAGVGLALSLAAMGETSEARTVLRRLFEAGYRNLDLLHALCNVPDGVRGLDILAALDRLKGSNGMEGPDAEITRMFIRGTVLDADGRHDDAWACFAAANQRMAEANEAECRLQAQREEASLSALAALLPRHSEGQATIDPRWPVSLFILGPSRAGKTSLERLVGALDGVTRGYENPAIDNALRKAFHAGAIPPTRQVDLLPAACVPSFREFYLEEIRRRASGARVLTQTAPARIHDVAFLAASVPNARFALVRRARDDAALRIYMRKYARGNAYAYDLGSIYRHLDWYERMATTLAARFPRLTCVLDYEDMVARPAEAVTAVAILCGLPAPHGPLPEVPDDRGCSRPYAHRLTAR